MPSSYKKLRDNGDPLEVTGQTRSCWGVFFIVAFTLSFLLLGTILVLYAVSADDIQNSEETVRDIDFMLGISP